MNHTTPHTTHTPAALSLLETAREQINKAHNALDLAAQQTPTDEVMLSAAQAHLESALVYHDRAVHLISTDRSQDARTEVQSG